MQKAKTRLARRMFMVLLAGLVVCTPAGAANLRAYRHNDTVRYDQWEAIYTAGGEANHVTLGGQGGHFYALRDPNVLITTPPFSLPYVSQDPGDTIDFITGLGATAPVRASAGCIAPHGRGLGVCVTTPGTWCNDGGCYTHTYKFEIAYLQLGGGNDSATLLPGSGTVGVYAGAGGDTLDTRNRVSDYVDCGDGADVVSADKYDRVASTCETVTWT